MRNKIHLVRVMALTAIIILSFSGFAVSKPLSLDTALSMAVRNNSSIKVAQLELDKANSAVREAFGYALPSLDFSSQFSHFIEKPKMPFPDFNAMFTNAIYGIMFKENVIPEDDSKFLPMETVLQSFALANSYSASLQLTQVLFSSTVLKGISSSGIYKQLAAEQLYSKLSGVILNTKQAFNGALLSQEVLKITQESFDNAQRNLESVRALQKQGMVAEFDAIKAEVQVENLRPMIVQMENNLEVVKDNLKLVLGMDMEEQIELVGTLDYTEKQIPDMEKAIAEAMENNYDLRALQLKRDFDEALIQLSISNYYPTLAAFGSYSLNGSSDNFEFQNYRQALVGLNFSINLFNGFRTNRKVEQGKITVMQTEENMNQFADFLSTRIKSKIIEINRIKANLDAQTKNVELAERAYDIANLRYKEGTGNQLEIENSDLALRQARTNRLQSVYQYISAFDDLENLMGRIETKYKKVRTK